MRKYIFFIALCIAFLQSGFSQSDEKANILAVERSVADAFTKHSLTNLNLVFADDINITTTSGDIINKQQLFQYVQRINSVTVSDMQVKIKGVIAIVTGIELETGKSDAGPYSNKSRFMDVLERKNGQWIIIASQSTAIGEQ